MKKNIIAVLALLAPLAVLAQSADYRLTIKLKDIKTPAKAYLVYAFGWTNQRLIDSAELKNDTFIFNGKVDEPLKADVVIVHTGESIKSYRKNADALVVYLDGGNILVSGTDSVSSARVTGSKINDEYARYYAQVLAPAAKTNEQLTADYKAAPAAQQKDKEFLAALMSKVKRSVQETDSLKYIYARQNPNSYLSLAALVELAGKNPNITKIEPIFKALNTNVRSTKSAKQLEALLYDNGPGGVGTMAIDFTQNDVNDKPIKLSDFKGKYVLLDFWASWCGPCRAENPNVVKAYDKYKDRNFTVLGVSLDQPGKKEAWLAAIKKDGLPWTQVSDLQFWNNAAARLYGIRAIPQNFLIDPNGKIIAKNLRGDALNEKLASLFK